MSETVLNRTAVFAAVRAHLEADLNDAGTPRFALVFGGEPRGLPPGGPYACYWYKSRGLASTSEGAGMTYGNVMYAVHIQIACFWPVVVERTQVEDWEADIWGADESLRRRFSGDSQLNSNVTDLRIGDSTVGYGPALADTPSTYRALMFELVLDNLEGEAVAA